MRSDYMKKYAIANANIITGKLGDGVQNGKYIVVEDGKIASITDDKSATNGLKVIDLDGKYILPGLINLHVHLPGSGMPKDTKKQNKKDGALFDGSRDHKANRVPSVRKLCQGRTYVGRNDDPHGRRP